MLQRDFPLTYGRELIDGRWGRKEEIDCLQNQLLYCTWGTVRLAQLFGFHFAIVVMGVA